MLASPERGSKRASRSSRCWGCGPSPACLRHHQPHLRMDAVERGSGAVTGRRSGDTARVLIALRQRQRLWGEIASTRTRECYCSRVDSRSGRAGARRPVSIRGRHFIRVFSSARVSLPGAGRSFFPSFIASCPNPPLVCAFTSDARARTSAGLAYCHRDCFQSRWRGCGITRTRQIQRWEVGVK